MLINTGVGSYLSGDRNGAYLVNGYSGCQF